MSSLVLHQALDYYARCMEALPELSKAESAKPEAVLAVLSARDAVQELLEAEGRGLAAIALRLIALDESLRERAAVMYWSLGEEQLERWRASLNPPVEAWWWRLEALLPPHPLSRLDGVWTLLAIAGWTANITLMVNLAARFLGGGVGLAGVAAIALPSLLGLLQAGNEFTKVGQEGFDRWLRSLKLGRFRVSPQLQQEVKLGLTLAMSLVLVGVWLNLPQFSTGQNRRGLEEYGQGRLGEAEQAFLKAIALDSDNADAYYNLGNLQEDLQQFEAAKKAYLIAIAGNVPDAYNNLGRLYLKEKKYAEASALLIQGIEKVGNEGDVQVRYSLFKNLGWVRLEQKRYEEAEAWLMAAIGLAEQAKGKLAVQPSAAHCLLAQALERQKKTAIAAWKQCQAMGNMSDPDEDYWLSLANQKLKN